MLSLTEGVSPNEEKLEFFKSHVVTTALVTPVPHEETVVVNSCPGRFSFKPSRSVIRRYIWLASLYWYDVEPCRWIAFAIACRSVADIAVVCVRVPTVPWTNVDVRSVSPTEMAWVRLITLIPTVGLGAGLREGLLLWVALGDTLGTGGEGVMLGLGLILLLGLRLVGLELMLTGLGLPLEDTLKGLTLVEALWGLVFRLGLVADADGLALMGDGPGGQAVMLQGFVSVVLPH